MNRLGFKKLGLSERRPVGPPGWTPAALSPRAWWKSNHAASNPEVGGSVPRRYDLSGNGFDLIQPNGAEQAVLVPNAMNGQTCLRFARAQRYPIPAGLYNITQGNNTALFVANNRNSGDGDNFIFGFGNADYSRMFGFQFWLGGYMRFRNGGNVGGHLDIFDIPVDRAIPHSGVSRKTGAIHEAWMDGAKVSGTKAAANFTSTAAYDGVFADGTFGLMRGDEAETVLVDRALTDDEIAEWFAYTLREWGV